MLLRRVSVTGYQMAVQSESRIVDENVVTRETSLFINIPPVGLSLPYVLNPDQRNRGATILRGREALRLEGSVKEEGRGKGNPST